MILEPDHLRSLTYLRERRVIFGHFLQQSLQHVLFLHLLNIFLGDVEFLRQQRPTQVKFLKTKEDKTGKHCNNAKKVARSALLSADVETVERFLFGVKWVTHLCY